MGVIVDPNIDPASIDNWALVSNSLVTNIIAAQQSFIETISQSYDYAVNTSVGGQSPKIGDTYNSGSDTFSATVIIPALSIAKTQNIMAFNVALQRYSDSYFTNQTQFRFFVLYYNANQSATLKPNRSAYIAPLFDWMNSIISYSATYVATVMAQVDAATALNYQWDFTQITTPPAITLMAAIQINT